VAKDICASPERLVGFIAVLLQDVFAVIAKAGRLLMSLSVCGAVWLISSGDQHLGPAILNNDNFA
jgi:hypothetical protein